MSVEDILRYNMQLTRHKAAAQRLVLCEVGAPQRVAHALESADLRPCPRQHAHETAACSSLFSAQCYTDIGLFLVLGMGRLHAVVTFLAWVNG